MDKYLRQIFFVFVFMAIISCSSGAKSFYEQSVGGVVVNMGVTFIDNPLVFSGAETKEDKGNNTHQLLFVFHDKKTGKPFSPNGVSVKLYSPSKKVLTDKEIKPGQILNLSPNRPRI
ncbi:MAG: hypothetical protein HZC45_02820 [Deltaproteobacteria bacterium]|nr:hypothetical protein [Deltaproteobacteria bacterium]